MQTSVQLGAVCSHRYSQLQTQSDWTTPLQHDEVKLLCYHDIGRFAVYFVYSLSFGAPGDGGCDRNASSHNDRAQ